MYLRYFLVALKAVKMKHFRFEDFEIWQDAIDDIIKSELMNDLAYLSKRITSFRKSLN